MKCPRCGKLMSDLTDMYYCPHKCGYLIYKEKLNREDKLNDW